MRSIASILTEYSDTIEFNGANIADVNQRGITGNTPLHLAVYRDDLEELDALLHAGADPNFQGEEGYTPLMAAVSRDNPEMVERILGAGARLDIPNDDGLTPMKIARSEKMRSILRSHAGGSGCRIPKSSQKGTL